MLVEYNYFKELIRIIEQFSLQQIEDKIEVLDEEVSILQEEVSSFFISLKKSVIHLFHLKKEQQALSNESEDKVIVYKNNIVKHKEKNTQTTSANYVLYRLRFEDKKQNYIRNDIKDFQLSVAMKQKFYNKVKSDLGVISSERKKAGDAKELYLWATSNDYNIIGLNDSAMLDFYHLYVRR